MIDPREISMTDSPTSPVADEATSSVPLVDLSKAETFYVNFCRVTGTPEELIIDFALQTDPAAPSETLMAPQRITLGFYTAKRLFQALQVTLQRHEAAFGAIETSIEARLLHPPASS